MGKWEEKQKREHSALTLMTSMMETKMLSHMHSFLESYAYLDSDGSSDSGSLSWFGAACLWPKLVMGECELNDHADVT